MNEQPFPAMTWGDTDRWTIIRCADLHRSHETYPRGSGKRILTADAVRTLRALYATGEWRQADLADAFGIGQSTVSAIVLGDRYAEVA